MIEEQKPDSPPSGKVTDLTTPQKILTAANSEFAEYGQAGARVDRIAEKAGVNKAMIYYHFSSKANLYLEVVKAHFANISERISQQIAEPKSIEDVLNGLADAYADLFAKPSDFLAIMLRELACPRTEFMEQVANIFGGTGFPHKILSLFQQSIKDGNLRQVDVKQALVSFVTMNIGYYIMAPFINKVQNITDPQAFINNRKSAVVDIFLNGLKAR